MQGIAIYRKLFGKRTTTYWHLCHVNRILRQPLASVRFEKTLSPLILQPLEHLLEHYRNISIEDYFRLVIQDRLHLFRGNARYIRFFADELQCNEASEINFFYNTLSSRLLI